MYLSFNDTAKRIGVTRPTLYKLIERGEITPAIVLLFGNQKRAFFLEDEVRALAMRRNPNLAIPLRQQQIA